MWGINSVVGQVGGGVKEEPSRASAVGLNHACRGQQEEPPTCRPPVVGQVGGGVEEEPSRASAVGPSHVLMPRPRRGAAYLPLAYRDDSRLTM